MRGMKLRVALVRGPIVSTARSLNNEATPCLGLAYVSAYARAHGYAPTIVDAIGEGLNRYWPLAAHPGYVCQGLTVEEMLERMPRDPDVIGFSAMFSGEWPVQRELMTAMRRAFPKAVLVAGGEHITALPEYSLRDCPALDVCVRGEGEHTFYELLEHLGEGRDLSAVNGVAYLDDDGQFRANEHMPRIRELDRIPWPDWPEGYLEKFWAAGKSYGVASARDMPLLVSRGCPYQCTFCSSPQMWTTLYRLRDADDVIAEIEHYRTRYAITSLQLYDLTAITKKSWTVEFTTKLLARGIDLKWSLPSGTRSEALDLGDRYFLQLTSLNSDYTRTNPLTLNPVMGPRELALYRISFMVLNYLVGYVLYPRRIWRTLRNVFMSRHSAATVFEHRLKDALGRKVRAAG